MNTLKDNNMEEQLTLVEKYLDKIVDFGFDFGPKILGAIVVLAIGLWITQLLTNLFGKSLEKSKMDKSLIPFLKSLLNSVLKVLIVISAMSMVGIQMTSFIAILGAVGLAIGMALSGTLQNFAGGVMILIFKPFKVDDFVEAQGYKGIIKEIGIFTTALNTLDNKLIIIPNGPLSTNSLTNFSTEEKRRVDWTFGMAYGDNVDDFKHAIKEFVKEDTRILDDPEVFIGLLELADSSVNFAVRAWVKSDDYWDVFFAMNEKVYTRFGDYKLNIPYPQMDIHIKNDK